MEGRQSGIYSVFKQSEEKVSKWKECQILLINQVNVIAKHMTMRLNDVKVNGDFDKSSYREVDAKLD